MSREHWLGDGCEHAVCPTCHGEIVDLAEWDCGGGPNVCGGCVTCMGLCPTCGTTGIAAEARP